MRLDCLNLRFQMPDRTMRCPNVLFKGHNFVLVRLPLLRKLIDYVHFLTLYVKFVRLTGFPRVPFFWRHDELGHVDSGVLHWLRLGALSKTFSCTPIETEATNLSFNVAAYNEGDKLTPSPYDGT